MTQPGVRRLIIDTDPGIDDALALLVALTAPDCEVVGLSIVGGNCRVDQAVSNTLAVLDLLGAEAVPVFRGAERPLTADRSWMSDIHGPTGLGPLEVTRRHLPAGRPEASQAIVDAVRDAPGAITIVALGPLTNVAKACQLEPRLGELVAGVVIMGGAVNTPGNTSDRAEANIWNDPHAADIVLSAGLPTTLVPLDVTRRAALPRRQFESRLRVLDGNPVVEFIRTVSRDYFKVRPQTPGEASAILHDPLALWVALDPTIVKTETMIVRVSIAEDSEVGRTAATADRTAEFQPAVEVALDVDEYGFVEDFLRRIEHAALVAAPGSSSSSRRGGVTYPSPPPRK